MNVPLNSPPNKVEGIIRLVVITPLILFCGLFLTQCNQKEYGRGYRYEHGGSYYGSNPSFSPDGTRLVFGSVRDGVGEIYAINIDGTNLRRLTNTSAYEGEPSFSPNGSRIIFISERSDPAYGKIFIMNTDGSSQKQLTFNKSYDFAPRFSPDGTKIIFVRDIGEYHTDIYIMNSDGSNMKRLTYDENPKSNPFFLKNAKRIRFSSFNLKTQGSEIYEINTDGSNLTLVLKLPPGCSEVAYSPDERKIAFIASRRTDHEKDFYTITEVFIANSDGIALKQLTDTKSYKTYPTFSPDGKKIMFLAEEKDGRGKGHIMIMNLDGSDLRSVANNY